MRAKKLSFNKAVLLLQDADVVLIENMYNGFRCLADTVTWVEEGDEKSDFIVSSEKWGTIRLPHGRELTLKDNVLLTPRYTDHVLALYEKKK